MTIKLEKIIDNETEDIYFKIRKSFINSITLTEQELKDLRKLIFKYLGDE